MSSVLLRSVELSRFSPVVDVAQGCGLNVDLFVRKNRPDCQ